ncbi:uncharacterized protein LOC103505287 [Diaphorina citri]|uniref:Uncharacterized protein LOC103505287 n=1 Tax=Diaphorina citri TaxID=121845 RepID=A0A1S3CVG0_DIACI|nr:uncharacterized protein LOC103505287 [Diaphorina citri]XP_008467839.1 uncharacterized protein LOC103505287 [Diaphorina citri]XP_026676433.1 uncharacterized protein LOC103505287 [Diaphorina citri]KAI5721754.1 hypothetical protein M8J77_025319 [Diaphorina citri]
MQNESDLGSLQNESSDLVAVQSERSDLSAQSEGSYLVATQSDQAAQEGVNLIAVQSSDLVSAQEGSYLVATYEEDQRLARNNIDATETRLAALHIQQFLRATSYHEGEEEEEDEF